MRIFVLILLLFSGHFSFADVYPNRSKTWNLDRAKVPGFDDRKRVHIPNIDPFAIVESRELSRGSNPKFLTDSGIYPNRSKTWNLDRAKVPGFDDRKRVHIPNIDPFAIVESRELSRGSNPKFLTDSGIFICDLACPTEQLPDKVPWKSRVRVEALKNLDDFLNWSLRETLRTYALGDPLITHIVRNNISAMQTFGELHGYFSLYHPMVGKVTSAKRDLETVRCLLQVIDQKIADKELKKFATLEVLSKILPYRDLKVGDTFSIHILDEKGELLFTTYTVDEVFDLWLGMPAFGLVPQGRGVPLLLFRGTDFSLDTQRGWASLMSDVDMAGPGLHAFQNAQPQIHAWLEKVAQTCGKARVLGFSLGGTLAAYAYILENPLINERGSYAFNLPGVSDQVIEKWNELSKEKRDGFVSFVNRGDVVSKVGKLFGKVYELSVENPMKPLTAHTKLISAEKIFYQMNVDVVAENDSRVKK